MQVRDILRAAQQDCAYIVNDAMVAFRVQFGVHSGTERARMRDGRDQASNATNRKTTKKP